MTPSEFDSLADTVLMRIAQALDESGADRDCETKGAGVLLLEFADGGRIDVNRHAAAQRLVRAGQVPVQQRGGGVARAAWYFARAAVRARRASGASTGHKQALA